MRLTRYRRVFTNPLRRFAIKLRRFMPQLRRFTLRLHRFIPQLRSPGTKPQGWVKNSATSAE